MVPTDMLIAQLSDLHLCEPGQLYHGVVDSNAMFARAASSLAALRPRPELLLVSGDLVEDGSRAAYAAARDALAPLGIPVLAIPGNHDDPRVLRDTFPDQPYVKPRGHLHLDSEDRWPVRILGLDVTVPGHHHGEMDRAARAWLSAALERRPGHPTILMMHHHPLPCGIGSIDAYACRNGPELVGILRGHPQVERVLCGHVHRALHAAFGGTVLTAAPSTATAIALRLSRDAEGASFVEPPAFLLHLWRHGAPMVTHAVPVGDAPGPYPFF